MKHIKKILAICLAMALFAGVLGGCNKSDKLSGSTVIMTIGDREITYDEYRYYFLYTKAQMDQGDATYWDKNSGAEDTLKKTVDDNIKSTVAQEKLVDQFLTEANQAGLNSEDTAAVDAAISSTIATLGTESDYAVALAAENMTADFYRKWLERSQLMKKMMTIVFSEGGKYAVTDDELKTFVAEKYAHVKHILLLLDTADTGTTNKDKATDLLKQVNEGGDFDALMVANSADYSEEYPDGYTFTTGEMVAEFETAAFALKENEVSDIVTTTYGYHIIKRLPIAENYFTDNRDTVLSAYQNSVLNPLLTDMTKTLEVKYSDDYEKLNLAYFLALAAATSSNTSSSASTAS